MCCAPRSETASALGPSLGVLTSSHITGRSPRCRNVALLRVIHHHAVCIEAPSQSADRSLHALDPATRKAVAIPLVIEWNDFFAESSHQVFSIAGIVDAHIGMCSAGSNGEAIHAIESFRPPSIQDGKIQTAVQDDFLTACARGLQRPARIV